LGIILIVMTNNRRRGYVWLYVILIFSHIKNETAITIGRAMAIKHPLFLGDEFIF
jgi:hypothetical protein